MKPLLLPVAEQIGRIALRRRGVASRRVSTPRGVIHVYDARGSGDLPTVVLLHGLGSAATFFGPLIEQLRPDVRRVVAPDYPGHGFSEAGAAPLTPASLFEAVVCALDALVREPIILVGTSLGGAVALHYALARPGQVRALVLVSPAGARASEEEWREIKRAFDVASRADGRAFLQRLYERPPWFLPLVAHEISSTLGRPAVRELLEAANNDHLPPPEELGALAMPVLLVWGKAERLLPESHFEYFARHLPKHAVIERPAGFGHCPHVDAPAELARRIVAFARAARADRTGRQQFVAAPGRPLDVAGDA
ncbi:MAG TPA: alpha/beta fold hydrolase [Polyangiaceae bacterium]|nr:alpha/beta fold hydrolase [Polyangiaceae bacterium]